MSFSLAAALGSKFPAYLLTALYVSVPLFDVAEPALSATFHATSEAGLEPKSPFVITEQQYELMFPRRQQAYSYQSLVEAWRRHPIVFNTSDEITRKQEAAAFFANIYHETDGLEVTRESNQANCGLYCDPAAPCAANRLYYGRGPIQLSWNYNYLAAGEALGVDLLHNPDIVAEDAAVGWATAFWFWVTQNGAGSMTPHQAMTQNVGFAETIQSINGSLECGRSAGDLNHAQMLHRVELYRKFAMLLGVPTGGNLEC